MKPTIWILRMVRLESRGEWHVGVFGALVLLVLVCVAVRAAGGSEMEASPRRAKIAQALQKLQEAGKKSPDLIKAKYRDLDREEIELNGLCYVLSECLYHLFPGEFTPYRISWGDGLTHWFLRFPDGSILDPIAPNGKECCAPEEYNMARRAAFLTKSPSKRARILLERAGLVLPPSSPR